MYGDQKKISKLGVLFTIVMVVIACVSGYLIYQQHKNDFKSHGAVFVIPKLPKLTASQEASLDHIEGMPLPAFGMGYSLIFQTPASATQKPPELDYLTNNSMAAIIATARSLCAGDSFSIRKTTTGFDVVTTVLNYPVTTVQCYDANNSWSFNIEPAIALASSEYTGTGTFQYSSMINGQVPAVALKSPLSNELWVNVRSLGPPIVRCNDNRVCYIDKSKFVTGGS